MLLQSIHPAGSGSPKALAADLGAIQSPCIGCAGCAGPCAALIEALTVPGIILSKKRETA